MFPEWPYLEGIPVEVPMMSVEDVGPVVEMIFNNPKDFLTDLNYIQLVGDKVAGEQVAKNMNDEVKGVEFREVPVGHSFLFHAFVL